MIKRINVEDVMSCETIDSMLVDVIDAMVGSGKTTWAINEINNHPWKRYIFVTPYLSEVERILNSSPSMDTPVPQDTKECKLDDFKYLLNNGSNIVTTHSLFKGFDEECYRLIRQGGYRLILDEVVSTVRILQATKKDIDLLKSGGLISVNPVTNELMWLDPDYCGEFNDLKKAIAQGNVFLITLTDKDNYIVAWECPVQKFVNFSTVTILTYLFEGQEMSAYFKINGINYRLWSLQDYQIVPYDKHTEHREKWADLISLYYGKMNTNYLDDPKSTKELRCKTKLSNEWYKSKKNRKHINKLNRNLENFYKKNCNIEDYGTGKLWSCYNAHKDMLMNNSYCNDGNFLSFNARAMNEYRDRTLLAYMINVYPNPLLEQYFNAKIKNTTYRNNAKTIFSKDLYAISTLIQWLGRSALRDDSAVRLYLPSGRMRDLLKKWFNYEI